MNYHVTCIITCEYDGDDYTIIANKSSSNSVADSTLLYRRSIDESELEDDELIDNEELLNTIMDLLE